MSRFFQTMFRTMSVLATVLIASTAVVEAQTWQRYVDPAHGATAIYPAHLFAPASPDPNAPGQPFLSHDGRAKLAIGSWTNSDNETPAQFRRKLLKESRYATLTYQPRGRSWFVLSGYRGDKVYYEKVIYSCGRRAVNALAIVYPVADRAIYDPVVERMEDHFRAGRRCD